MRHGLARDRVAFALLPVLDVERLRQLAGAVVLDRGQDDVLLDAQHLRGDFREFLGDPLKISQSLRDSQAGSTAACSGWMKGCMSEVLRSFFSYQVAVGSTMSE
jgi:hypothetical protein